MLARDHRFDGQFFVGVKTTGIYCRPVCPAKPKRENVEFFPNHLAAEKAGYRPCLRCRPESAPMSPAWIGRSVLVKRAVKMLHEQNTLDFSEDEFAARFGVTARHLRRVFNEELGKTPKQLAADNRLNLARQLLTETSLAITEVAYASGFRSVRRFNDAFKTRFKRNPSGVRRVNTRTKKREGGLTLYLTYRPPYDFAGLLWIYRMHRVGNLEWFEGETMHRVVTYDGRSGMIAISDQPEQSRLKLEIDFPEPSAIYPIVANVRAMFDLDSDPVLIANILDEDAGLKKILKKNPGIRIASGWDAFEIAVGAILGQLVTVDFGRTLTADLIEMLGVDSGLVREGVAIKLFPTPEKIASSRLEGLRTTGKRKQTLIEFSRRVAAGEISLAGTQDVEAFIAAVRTVPGIGPWTANYMALRVLRHADAFPGTDLILARAQDLHGKDCVEKMSPWRGYVAALFWREYALTLKKKREKA